DQRGDLPEEDRGGRHARQPQRVEDAVLGLDAEAPLQHEHRREQHPDPEQARGGALEHAAVRVQREREQQEDEHREREHLPHPHAGTQLEAQVLRGDQRRVADHDPRPAGTASPARRPPWTTPPSTVTERCATPVARSSSWEANTTVAPTDAASTISPPTIA